MAFHFIKRNGRQRRKERRRMCRNYFCRHLDNTESSLEMKVMKQSSVKRRCYLYVTHKFTYIMHTLVIRSHTLRLLYSNACTRFTYVTRTLAYATHTVINATLTVVDSSGFKHSNVVRICIFFSEILIANCA